MSIVIIPIDWNPMDVHGWRWTVFTVERKGFRIYGPLSLSEWDWKRNTPFGPSMPPEANGFIGL